MTEQPVPPWVWSAGASDTTPRDWRSNPYISSVWRPFWDACGAQEQAAYLSRFPPPPGWDRFLEDVAFDQQVARIDAEDIASGVLQPNGLPWPEPKTPRPSLWRRLLGRR